jgi:hypothetical protein
MAAKREVFVVEQRFDDRSPVRHGAAMTDPTKLEDDVAFERQALQAVADLLGEEPYEVPRIMSLEHADDLIRFAVRVEAQRLALLARAPQTQWVSVKERLPEIVRRWKDGPNRYESSALVLIWNGELEIGYYYGNGGWASKEGSRLDSVTRWREIAPPEVD